MKLMRICVFALLAFAVIMAGCSGSQVHKANRAAKQIADDLHEFEASVETFCAPLNGHCTGALADDEAKSLAQLASDATAANDTFVGQVKTLPPTASSAPQVTVWFADLTAAIQKLNDQGLTHVKNPQAKANLTLIFQSIQTALGTLSTLLQTVQKPASVSRNIPYDQIPVERGDLNATGITLLLAAFSSITKLIAQARADGSLTDEQLEQATLAEDENTRNKAAAFIKQLNGGQ